MRILLDGLDRLASYIDDVLAHAETISQHIDVLRQFFQRVKGAKLRLKPSKCELGYSDIEFLGHLLKGDKFAPKATSISKIQKLPRPVTDWVNTCYFTCGMQIGIR